MKKYLISLLAAFIFPIISVTAQNYNEGQTINIKANFTQDLGPTSIMTVLLNNGKTLVLDQVNGKVLSGDYLIGVNEQTPDLSIREILSSSVTNINGNTNSNYKLPSTPGDLVAENSNITRNLGDSANITIGSFRKIPVPSRPYGISNPISLNGNQYIYVACQGAAQVVKVDAYTDKIVATYDVGLEPYGLTPIEINSIWYIYVANTGSDTVSVINTSTNTVSTIPVGVKPYYVTASALLGKVFVTNSLSNNISVIDAATQTVIAEPFTGTYPRSLVMHGNNIYSANYGDANYGGGDSISVTDGVTHGHIATIPFPLNNVGPRGITLARNHYLFAANYLSNNVTLINPHFNKIFPTPEDGNGNVPASLPVGKGPRGILAANNVGKVYVENFDEGTISVINSLTFSVIGKVTVGHSPSGMSLVGNKLYVSSFQDNCIYVLDTRFDKLKVPILVEGLIQYEFFDDYEFNKIERTTVFNEEGKILKSISFDVNGNVQRLYVDNGATLNIPNIELQNLDIGNASVAFGPLTSDELRFYSSNYIAPAPAAQKSPEVLKRLQRRDDARRKMVEWRKKNLNRK